jgi:hypothetical protein
MRFFLWLLIVGGCLQVRVTAGTVEPIDVGTNGSVAFLLPVPGSEPRPAILNFHLPTLVQEPMEPDSGHLRLSATNNGIHYTFTALTTLCRLTDSKEQPPQLTPALLIQVRGENTDSEYREASVDLALEVAGQRKTLEIKGGAVWAGENPRQLVGMLEVSESGIKSARGERLQFSGNMPPSIKGELTLKIALAPLSESTDALDRLADLDFDRELQQTKQRPPEQGTRPLLVVGSAQPQPARKDIREGDPGAWVPSWWPQPPPLPAPEGDIVHARSAEELLVAAEGLRPDQTLIIADGEYRLPRVLLLDQRTNVVIRSASGDPSKVVLRGQGWEHGSERDDILHIGRCDGVTIAGITFADCRSYGVKVEAEHGPRNIHLYRCAFRDIGVRALKGSAGQNSSVRAVKGSVRYCTFENTRVPPADWLFGGDYISAIDMMALEDWTFSDNAFRNIKGRRGGGRAAIFIWVRSRLVTVERNFILDCDRGIAFGNPGGSTANNPAHPLAYVSDSVIRNNMITGGADCGIELWHSTRLKILHNTVWRPEQNWARGIRVGAGISQTDILHNLVHGKITLEGGVARIAENLTGTLTGFFNDPGAGDLALTPQAKSALDQVGPHPDAPTDIRNRPRRGEANLGAWELDP